MARTLSWLNRIVPIARAVAESNFSHYGREDLQRLFEIQPRSAQNLMAAMPLIIIGNAHLVERAALSALLQHLKKAEDPTRAFAVLRTKCAKSSRRKLRAFSLKDVSVDLDSLPKNFILTPGEITIRFESVDQLAEGMVYLAGLLQNHLDDFAVRYEPLRTPVGEGIGGGEEERLDAAYIEHYKYSNKV